MARKKSKGKLTKQQRALLHKKKMRKRIILLVVEIILLLVLGAAAYAMSKLDKLDFKTVDTSNLEIYQDTGEFTNIALFGLDSREGELDGGVRSDSMMIASIDNKTKNVKVVSVFRDTLTPVSYTHLDAVYYMYWNGLMTGLNSTTFGASEKVSRGQFVTILYRMAGSPEVSYSPRFPDVKNNEFYTSGALWASSAGITTRCV